MFKMLTKKPLQEFSKDRDQTADKRSLIMIVAESWFCKVRFRQCSLDIIFNFVSSFAHLYLIEHNHIKRALEFCHQG